MPPDKRDTGAALSTALASGPRPKPRSVDLTLRAPRFPSLRVVAFHTPEGALPSSSLEPVPAEPLRACARSHRPRRSVTGVLDARSAFPHPERPISSPPPRRELVPFRAAARFRNTARRPRPVREDSVSPCARAPAEADTRPHWVIIRPAPEGAGPGSCPKAGPVSTIQATYSLRLHSKRLICRPVQRGQSR
jgi:hypothetical protein